MGSMDEHLGKIAKQGWLQRIWAAFSERYRAQQVCRELLGIYHEVKAANPNLSGELLYQQIVVRYKNTDVRQAKQWLNLAEESFAQWPQVRDLNYRDVVLYMLVIDAIIAVNLIAGVPLAATEIVASVIPADL